MWVYGKIVNWALPKHITKECLPKVKEMNMSEDDLREVFHIRLDKIFDEIFGQKKRIDN